MPNMQITPNYISILFAVVLIILSYLILNWIWNSFGSRSSHYSAGLVEGYSNPQYTYKPNGNAPNLSIKFGLADLAIDISSVCGFIKIDSKLNSLPSATTSPSPSATTSPSPFYTTSPSLSSTSSPSPFSTTSPSSSDSDNNQGSTPTPAATTISTSSSSSSNANDYTIPYTQLSIYKMYNDATGYSSTSNANIFKMMDASYGSLFDSSVIANMTDSNIEKMWNANASTVLDDALYNASYFFVIQSGLTNRKCDFTQKGLSSYFLGQIKKNKANTAVLTSLKNAYYSVIKPRFLANTLSNVYWQNVKSLTNSDKGTSNSILFVVNTLSSLATANTLSADLSQNEVANILSADSPFTLDSLWLYQMVSIVFELYRYCAYFQKNKIPYSITTTLDTFHSGYQRYLEKINQIVPDSPILFFSQNPPSQTDCSIVNSILPYMKNISN